MSGTTEGAAGWVDDLADEFPDFLTLSASQLIE